MEALLYNLLNFGIIEKWRTSEEKKDSYYTQCERESLERLKAGLSEKDIELLKSYSLAIENRTDELFYNVSIKIFNLGIQIGMQLNQAFHEFDED